MNEQILDLLKQVFEGDKQTSLEFIKSLGYKAWQQLVDSDDESKREVLTKLQEMKKLEYEVVEAGDYTIFRPKNPRYVKDIRFTFKGMKL
jgi:hypothetical protein